MATWNVQPVWKKSVIERNYMTKGSDTIMVETGWRWGEFLVYTDDDNPPDIEAGVDIFNCDYETEMIETFDGCWEEIDYDDCSDETREWIEEFLEDNSYYDLEEHGWEFGDCEMIIDCDLEITKVNDDGTEGEKIITGEETEISVAEKLEPNAAWPFSRPEEGPTEYAKFKCINCDYETEDIMDLVENPNDDDKGALLCPKCNSKVDLG